MTELDTEFVRESCSKGVPCEGDNVWINGSFCDEAVDEMFIDARVTGVDNALLKECSLLTALGDGIPA